MNNSRKVENKGGNVWGGQMIGSGLWSIACGGVGVRAGRGWRFIGDTKRLGCSPGEGGTGSQKRGLHSRSVPLALASSLH